MMPCAAGLWRNPSRIIRLGALATKTRTAAAALAHHPAHRQLPPGTEGPRRSNDAAHWHAHHCQ